MAQSVGPTASATAGATDASGGVGGSDVQLDDAEVRPHWQHRQSTAHMTGLDSVAAAVMRPSADPTAANDAICHTEQLVATQHAMRRKIVGASA